MSDPKHKKKDICWTCGEYTFTYMYGINGLCLSCLQEREDNEVDDNNDNDKDRPLIGRYARAYIDYLSKNDKTSRNYNPELNRVVAEDTALKYNCIDRCKKYDFSYLNKYMNKSKKNIGS